MKTTTKTKQSPAIALIDEERQRQIIEEGFTVESDLTINKDGQLCGAAACYAIPTAVGALWPWDAKWWKPSPDDRKREIIKACALLVAEWDRLEAEEKGE